METAFEGHSELELINPTILTIQQNTLGSTMNRLQTCHYMAIMILNNLGQKAKKSTGSPELFSKIQLPRTQKIKNF